MLKPSILATGLASLAGAASAEIITASPDHYTLRHEAVSPAAPQDVWDRLIQPDTWWHPDHTFSGDAQNLSLDAEAGGAWLESWDGNSVEHGRVLTLMEGQSIRLDAPFGPLQGMAVNVVWTITIEPDGNGTRVIFDEIANGSSASGLDKIAPAVDGVKQQAIEGLTMLGATD
jgi:hypothetical protein